MANKLTEQRLSLNCMQAARGRGQKPAISAGLPSMRQPVISTPQNIIEDDRSFIVIVAQTRARLQRVADRLRCCCAIVLLVDSGTMSFLNIGTRIKSLPSVFGIVPDPLYTLLNTTGTFSGPHSLPRYVVSVECEQSSLSQMMLKL